MKQTTTTTIFDLLVTDHQAVVALVKEAVGATGKQRHALIEQIVDELTAHSTAEEEIFYAAIAGGNEALALTIEAKEEHLSAARLLSDLLDPTYSVDVVTAKLTVLGEQLEHHIKEEEGEMFAMARRQIDEQVAEGLGGEFLARKAELTKVPVAVRVQETIAKHMAVSRIPDVVKKIVNKALDALDALDPH